MDETAKDPGTDTLLATTMPWIDDQLSRHGITRSGSPGEPRVRSWATVIAIPTGHGTVWFKAASPLTAHEIPLYPLLVRAAPELVLHPLAADTGRAWMLLPDGGTSLLHTLPGDALVSRLVEVAPRYAELQISMAAHVPAMLDVGVPDMRPETLPGRFEDALTGAERAAQTAGSVADLAALREVAAMRPRISAWWERLAASPVRASIDHSDLHANNVLLPEGPSGRALVYDWGDSVITHPFSSLLVMLRSLMDRLQTTPNDPQLGRVRDAYLEPFSDVARHDDLIEIADAACWTSVVIRAVTWVRVLELGPPADPAWATAPAEWMKTYLNASWLG